MNWINKGGVWFLQSGGRWYVLARGIWYVLAPSGGWVVSDDFVSSGPNRTTSPVQYQGRWVVQYKGQWFFWSGKVWQQFTPPGQAGQAASSPGMGAIIPSTVFQKTGEEEQKVFNALFNYSKKPAGGSLIQDYWPARLEEVYAFSWLGAYMTMAGQSGLFVAVPGAQATAVNALATLTSFGIGVASGPLGALSSLLISIGQAIASAINQDQAIRVEKERSDKANSLIIARLGPPPALLEDWLKHSLAIARAKYELHYFDRDNTEDIAQNNFWIRGLFEYGVFIAYMQLLRQALKAGSQQLPFPPLPIDGLIQIQNWTVPKQAIAMLPPSYRQINLFPVDNTGRIIGSVEMEYKGLIAHYRTAIATNPNPDMQLNLTAPTRLKYGKKEPAIGDMGKLADLLKTIGVNVPRIPVGAVGILR